MLKSRRSIEKNKAEYDRRDELMPEEKKPEKKGEKGEKGGKGE